uniref:Uncharacterized protein n=1 Tax=Lepeophtheirus salmonis TaxID=72036 RepID=A0A0K2T125_LEPSM
MVHPSFDVAKLSSPLHRKTLPIHNVSTPMFDRGDFSSSKHLFCSFNQTSLIVKINLPLKL